MKDNGIDRVDGFKENTDYFRMSDGVFWTIEALAAKYDCAVNTIYKKGKELEIPTMNVLNIKCYKDDKRFEKSKGGSGNIDHLKDRQLPNYAQVARMVEDMVEQFKINNDINNQWHQRFLAEVSEIKLAQSRLTNFVNKLNEVVVKNEETLQEILSYLTKGEKKDA
jgi:hypothetical protein